MIFLIEYNRLAGHIVAFQTFDDSDQLAAENLRLERELKLNRRLEGIEIVLLQASSEDALRQTHRRYFETASEIVRSTSSG